MRSVKLARAFLYGIISAFSIFASTYVAAFDLSKGEQQWLKQHPAKIVFTGDPNWLPFEAFDSQGQYLGIVPSFLKKFTADTGIEFEFRQTNSWSETLELANKQQVDVLSDVLGSLTLRDNYTFTNSYISNNLVIISNSVGGQINDINDISPSPIGIIKGYGYTWELYERYPDTYFIEVENIQAGLAALEDGKFNYLITTYALGQFQLTTLEKNHLSIRGQLPVQAHLAFAVRKDWPQLNDIFNRWIDSLSPEQRYQIAESWYLDNTNYFSKNSINWTYVIWSSLIMFLLISITSYAWYSRYLINRQKKHFKASLSAIDAAGWRMVKQSSFFQISRAFKGILPFETDHPKSLSDLINLAHPHDQESVYEAFRQARLDSNKPIDVEFRLNGDKSCWLAVKGSTVDEHSKKALLIGTIENITNRKVMEAEKQQSNAIVSLLFEVLPDLVVLDLFGQQEPIANRAYRTFFNQQSLFESLPNDQKIIWMKQEDTLIKAQKLCHTSTWVSPNTERKAYVSIIRTPFVNSDKQVIGILSVARDITDTFLLQQELQEAKHRADQANDSKSVFLANMSHEIRTPLNAILGYAQLLQQENLGQESNHQIQRIYSAGHRLLGLINDILDLSKIEAGRLQLNETSFPIKKELQELATMHRQRAETKGLSFQSNIQLNDHDHVFLDKTKFGQIISNALDNAVKFTDQGAIKLIVQYRKKHLKIQILDTGPGICSEDLDRLFSPFSQGQSGKTHGGTGLGLILSRRLADAMGGSFTLHSTVNQGTEVQVSIPVTLNIKTNIEDKEAKWQLPHGSVKTALIVEDDELSRDMLEHMLKKIGFSVLLAEDGEQALDYLNAHIDVVFSDIRMPNMDGMTLIKHIRSNASLQALPVIAVTASSFDHEKRHFLSNGFSNYIPKPVALQQLCQSLRDIMTLIPCKDRQEEEKVLTGSGPTANPNASIDKALQDELHQQFQEACKLGDADEALICLNKLQDSAISPDKLDIIRKHLERYDFEKALSVDL
ncbi:ATP-binding protein [Marinomonas atlantica]|uniref:ATP-binding protein n=1 Tax=Marinomonas atlantica TaxID=1806668 RepID=UPI0008379DFC|nr:ATP-binding protein [Marinomonas atlantica]MCO4784417.1 response regulator [Marinomonas atlantica]